MLRWGISISFWLLEISCCLLVIFSIWLIPVDSVLLLKFSSLILFCLVIVAKFTWWYSSFPIYSSCGFTLSPLMVISTVMLTENSKNIAHLFESAAILSNFLVIIRWFFFKVRLVIYHTLLHLTNGYRCCYTRARMLNNRSIYSIHK